jgi:hypothetical protein
MILEFVVDEVFGTASDGIIQKVGLFLTGLLLVAAGAIIPSLPFLAAGVVVLVGSVIYIAFNRRA